MLNGYLLSVLAWNAVQGVGLFIYHKLARRFVLPQQRMKMGDTRLDELTEFFGAPEPGDGVIWIRQIENVKFLRKQLSLYREEALAARELIQLQMNGLMPTLREALENNDKAINANKLLDEYITAIERTRTYEGQGEE